MVESYAQNTSLHVSGLKLSLFVHVEFWPLVNIENQKNDGLQGKGAKYAATEQALFETCTVCTQYSFQWVPPFFKSVHPLYYFIKLDLVFPES